MRATYKEPPRSAELSLLVSAASKDEDDVTVEECDARMVESLTLTANSEQAVLEVSLVEGVLTAAPQWNGTTVSYSFSSPTLNQVFAPGASDPFACTSGSADEDGFYGSLAGRLLKLTPRIGADALARELARRFGSRFTSSPRRQVRCPRRGILKATERSDDRPGMAAHALCNFEFRQTATTIRAGSASVFLASGVPQITDFASRKRPSALESCGIFGDRGAGSLRWGAPPAFGFFIEVWAQRAPCLSARRIARGWNGNRAFRGYRCQVVERRYEFSAVRCTRAGKRVVRWETGA